MKDSRAIKSEEKVGEDGDVWRGKGGGVFVGLIRLHKPHLHVV